MANQMNSDIIKKLKSLTESDIDEIIKKLEAASGIKSNGGNTNLFKEKLDSISGSEISRLMKNADKQSMSDMLDNIKLSGGKKDGK